MLSDRGRGTDRVDSAPGQAEAAVPVLIVDDDARKRLALKAVLAPLGYRIVEADSGVAALRCLMDEDFAVILLDVRMPIMDGFETAQMVRQRQQSELTPIIFITAFGRDAMSDMAAYATGAADFIFSPVPTAELQAKVSVFANIYRRAKVLAAQAQALQESADELALLTNAAPIGIFRTSAENTYVYVNARWSEITGLSFEQAIGQPWEIVMSEEQAAEHRPKLFEPGDTGDALSHSRFEIKHAGESESLVVQGTTKPLRSSDNAVVGWVGTLSDVTAQELAKATMLAARDAALETTLMQNNFTVSASHELRTPTTCILGFIEEVLENDALSEDDRKCLDIAYRSAQRLSRLIDDLLILGEEDIGAGRMSVEPTAVVPLVDRVVASFSATAEQGGLSLVTDPGTGAETDRLCALVDPVRLEQALTNLVGNALKFTPPGGQVEVTVGTAEDVVQIAVKDTGMGIDPEALDGIFSRFYRAREATEGGVKGTGLGLAIALQMIEAQDGQLSVTSDVGRGSTFTITLPQADAQVAV